VLASDDTGVTVFVVGVGRCRYRREDLTPRRAGQVRYAVEREAYETALRPCVVLEATVGSRAWGLSDGDSDTDRRGIFLLPFPWTTGLGEAPTSWSSVDGSETWWEFERALRQLLRADPNTLEMLWVPDARALDPVAEALLRERDAFTSVEVYGTFGRYALSQVRKLAQAARLAEHRSAVLAWLSEAPELSLDAVAVRLATHTGDATPEALVRCRQYLKQLYRSMHDQGLLPAANWASLVAFAAERAHDFDLPRELRPKNAYNLLRLIASATHWLRTGEPIITVTGELRERLLAIKHGKVPLERSLAWTEALAGELEEARQRTRLPKRPDLKRADAILRTAREEAARRWFVAAPGPWGRDAPAPPAVIYAQEAAQG